MSFSQLFYTPKKHKKQLLLIKREEIFNQLDQLFLLDQHLAHALNKIISKI